MADEQRSLALGAQSVAFRAFGTIPGPIIFGAIIDSVCLYWQYECGRRGNCWVYDNAGLSLSATVTLVLAVAIFFVFCFLTWLFYPKSKVPTTHTNEKDSPPLDSSKSSVTA